jgi:lipopolysaccharide transport system permease protein
MIVFTVFLGLVSRFPSDGVPYPVFYFSALTLWSYFSSAVLMSGDSLIGNAPILTRVYVPRIFIPAAPICSGLVDLLLSLGLLSVLSALYGYPPTGRLLVVPVSILMVTVTALGTGLLMSPLIVRYRDFQNVMSIVIQVWMFVSPVIYPFSLVPDRWRIVYSLNPLAGAIEGLRWSIFGIGPLPWLPLTVGFFSGALILVVGLIHFRKTEEYFADYV